MQKTIVLSLATCLAAPTASLAQQPAKLGPTAAALKKSFARIEGGTEGESDAFDELTVTTARQLVAYLKTHEVLASQAKYMGLGYLASKDAAQLKVFTYTYSSGGTRGTIYRPVFQWRNAAGQLFAYSFGQEWGFAKLHKLSSPADRTQYLLLGAERGDGLCVSYEAYVVELRGDYLLLDKPAFGSKPSFRLCNVYMDFDDKRQVLHLDLSDEQVPDYNDENLAQMGYHHQPHAKSILLKFNNGHFVRSQ